MDTLDKLRLLGESAKYDVCAATSTRRGRSAFSGAPASGICHSFTPDGRCISLFKVLLSNECEQDCLYCPNRVQRDVPRSRFTPEELATLFLAFYRRNYVEGLFLSSGIFHSPLFTMDEMLKTAALLRYKHKYRGYLHLKILPGAQDAQIQEAARLADRISLNMETVSTNHLRRLSQKKQFQNQIMRNMQSISTLTAQAGITHTTQYLIGAAGENDGEILASVNSLYTGYQLHRACFSAFQPVTATPLAHLPPASLTREHRLYQSDFLLRNYHFSLQDLVFAEDGNLYQNLDPKLARALHHPELFPIEINRASRPQLLTIPGVGPLIADRILRVRRQSRFTQPEELKNLGLSLKRALSFLTINGRYYGRKVLLNRPHPGLYRQLSLWE